MSDLRTGLVEAMTKGMASAKAEWKPPYYGMDQLAAAALDAALGFLTDNADQWYEATGWSFTSPPIEALIAALSDGRDTGEKP